MLLIHNSEQGILVIKTIWTRKCQFFSVLYPLKQSPDSLVFNSLKSDSKYLGNVMCTPHLIFITTMLKLHDTKRLRWVPFLTHSSFTQYPAMPQFILCSSFLQPDGRVLYMCELSPELSHSLCNIWITRNCPCFRNSACLRGWQNEREGIPVLPLLSRESAPVMDLSHNSGLLSSFWEVQSVNKGFKEAWFLTKTYFQ